MESVAVERSNILWCCFHFSTDSVITLPQHTCHFKQVWLKSFCMKSSALRSFLQWWSSLFIYCLCTSVFACSCAFTIKDSKVNHKYKMPTPVRQFIDQFLWCATILFEISSSTNRLVTFFFFFKRSFNTFLNLWPFQPAEPFAVRPYKITMTNVFTLIAHYHG